MSDERHEHHCRCQEYCHAQQDYIDDVTHVGDDDGALGTRGLHRHGDAQFSVPCALSRGKWDAHPGGPAGIEYEKPLLDTVVLGR